MEAPKPDVALLARGLFTGGADGGASQLETEDALERTRMLLMQGEELLYDAAFAYNGVLVTVDILSRRRNRWYASVVRCATSVKPAHMADAALQALVLDGNGIRLSGSQVIYLNKTYVRRGALDLEQLFLATPVTKAVRGMLPSIELRIARMKRLLEADMPFVAIGAQCHKPGPCWFHPHCAGMEETTREAEGDAPIEVDRPAVGAFLERLQYPLQFVDFEAYQPPVPEYEGHWPYRQVPFQYSLHVQHEPGAAVTHRSFLAEASGDPGRTFLESLLRDLEAEGSVIVFGRSTESTILAQMGRDHPDLEEAALAVRDRLVDLAVPFLEKQVLIPSLKGRSSLKAVLPALLPGQSYEGLAIADGGDAHRAFSWLRQETDPARMAQIRADLLAYCALDTWAMVLILERLRSL